ncbi:hypothetical protein C476_11121 [Natrinema limicola JCM 13563]|uniref:Uncharacterized protein n=1 Tax=Natrinema limicola JCM 13563 TaxID=1230457 RepID=M0CCR2_9EURY|nr:hypothetical protein C476_11121 [Natrinema limicola JCM 13563]
MVYFRPVVVLEFALDREAVHRLLREDDEDVVLEGGEFACNTLFAGD